jgi:tetratricopeptide (TPR) repeat protein
MYQLAYDGRFVHFRYAQSIQDPDARIAEFEKLAARNEADGNNNGHVHNLLGYAYYTQGDKDKAKMHFKKYLELRPDGYNAYDSMAEYYRNEGKLEKSLEYYKKARNKYPGSTSARAAIEELNTEIANKDKGNLLVMHSEYVVPEHMDEYMQWGKEYKELAQKTKFKDFYVSAGDGAFHYIVNVGKEMSGIEEYEEAWEQWGEDNPELGEMFEKYRHTVRKSENLVWRHLPAHSYAPEEASDSPNTYSRVYFAYPKYGHEGKMKDLISEFKTLWEASGVTEGFQVYENVYGKEAGCVAIVSSFGSPKEWMADEEDVKAKVDQEKLQGLMSEWGKHIRKGENVERYPQADLSHSNPPEN